MSEYFYEITGGRALYGEANVLGAKNAVLPLLAACLICDEACEVKNCPDISDVQNMLALMKGLGVHIERENRTIKVSGSASKRLCGLKGEIESMRSSMFLLGALIQRTGEVALPSPGGCKIGSRPLDIHFDGLKRMGAKVFERDGVVMCKAKKLVGADIVLRYPSVGATENLLICAAKAKGVTRLVGAAKEPEVVSLAQGLCNMGARITGAGTDVIEVEGVSYLHGASLDPCPDRIVAGTIMAACLICGGEVDVRGAKEEHLTCVTNVLSNMGAEISFDGDVAHVRSRAGIRPARVATSPYPGFATDMQPQTVACMCFSKGVSSMEETVFDNRFVYAKELKKMGANITENGNSLMITGGKLHGADMCAPDLRGGAGLVLASLGAEGVSRVFGTHFIERGYEHFDDILKGLGADIVKKRK